MFGFGSSEGDPVKKQNLTQRMVAAAGKLTKDESIKTAVRLASTASDSDAQDPFAIADKMATKGVISPEQREEFANILAAVRGQ